MELQTRQQIPSSTMESIMIANALYRTSSVSGWSAIERDMKTAKLIDFVDEHRLFPMVQSLQAAAAMYSASGLSGWSLIEQTIKTATSIEATVGILPTFVQAPFPTTASIEQARSIVGSVVTVDAMDGFDRSLIHAARYLETFTRFPINDIVIVHAPVVDIAPVHVPVVDIAPVIEVASAEVVAGCGVRRVTKRRRTEHEWARDQFELYSNHGIVKDYLTKRAKQCGIHFSS